MNNNPNYQLAVHDFQSAHLHAKLQGVLARVRGKSNLLLSYEEIASKLKLQGRYDKGVHSIPVDAIVGSVGRYTDFTRTFLPRRSADEQRWALVKAATMDLAGLPPIEVYQVSEVYFVLDGNHRVSIARQEGAKFIEAHVIEVRTDIPLTPDIQLDDIIIKAEYAEFLGQTELNKSDEQIDLSTTKPGGYQKLLDEICLCRCQIEEEGQKTCSLRDSAESWYRDIYLPFAEAVRERGMLRWFPNRTVTDLYVWMSEHREELEKELGWTIRPETAAEAVIQQRNRRATSEESKTGSWRKARLINRYTEHLFRDILVPIGMTSESWDALDQAIAIAQKENANLHGLHVVDSKQELNHLETSELQTRFTELCEKANVQGGMAVEVGEPTQKILERAVLTDLIVMKIAYPPSVGVKALSSNIRTLIARAPRPMLGIPGQTSRMERALLAFDGSPKSKEALFVATYLAEQWNTELTVLTGLDDERSNGPVEDFARNYLEFNEINASFLTIRYSHEALNKTVEQIGADLVIMGGYSGSILKEMTIGSSVNYMLRESEVPVFICR